MGRIYCLVLFICFLLIGLIGCAAGIYLADTFVLGAGILLILASTLIFLEYKKIR
ncbi:hypothetical protein [Acinetobacter terrae]|uniref:hypothetical protein n=1 Tax=Acinetobacter terrae TaxID=2731247 RepID=UPI000AD1CFB0|nr:hypothetical protein [Acinetobacter terrae]